MVTILRPDNINKKLEVITADNFFKDKPHILVENFKDIVSPWIDKEEINEKSYDWKSLYNKPLNEIAPHNYLIMNPINDKKSEIELSELDQLDLDSQNFASRKLDYYQWTTKFVDEQKKKIDEINNDPKKKFENKDPKKFEMELQKRGIDINSLRAGIIDFLYRIYLDNELNTYLMKPKDMTPEETLINNALEPVTLFFLTASAEIYRDYLVDPKLASKKLKSLRTFLDQALTLPGMKDDTRIKDVEKKIDDLGKSLKII